MVNTITIALSGLEAASKRLQASASNIANLQTVGSLEEGGQAPYTPLATQQTTQIDAQGNPLAVSTNFSPINNPFVPTYDPDSPFANEEGLIGAPNINLAGEAVNLKLAELSYKANLLTIKTAEEMSEELLNIFDDKV